MDSKGLLLVDFGFNGSPFPTASASWVRFLRLRDKTPYVWPHGTRYFVSTKL